MHKCLICQRGPFSCVYVQMQESRYHCAAGEPYWKAAGIEDKIKLHIGAANDTLVELLAVRRFPADVTCLR